MLKLGPIGCDEAASVFALESKIWPPYLQATTEQLIARQDVFPAGTVVVQVDGMPVGFGTSQVISLSDNIATADLTCYLPQKGVIARNHDPAGNCLHLMSGGVVPEYRRRGLWTLLVEYRKALARLLRLQYVLVDTRMPFYKQYCDTTEMITPAIYAKIKSDGRYLDPLLGFFQSLSFEMVCVSESSYEDPDSGNQWAFMIMKIKETTK